MSTRARTALAYGLALLALGGVFALYLRPDFMVTVSNLAWACFGL